MSPEDQSSVLIRINCVGQQTLAIFEDAGPENQHAKLQNQTHAEGHDAKSVGALERHGEWR